MFVGRDAHAANWAWTSGVQFQETWSDNIALGSAGQERSELVTQVTPSVRVAGQSARLKVEAGATWDFMNYAHGSSGNRRATTLNGTGVAELLDNWLYMDGMASISRQAVSAFGSQFAQAVNLNANTTQVINYSLAPYVKGVLWSDLVYNLRMQRAWTSMVSDTGGLAGNSRSSTLTGSLRWGGMDRLFNFEVNHSSSLMDLGSSGSYSRTTRLYAYFNPEAHMSFEAHIGFESNGGSTGDLQATFRGVGFQWQPDSRTNISLGREFRYFGPADRINFSHRFRRAALNIDYNRDRTTTQGLLLNNATSNYYQLYSNMLTAAYPDPGLRDVFVRQMLLAQGISPDAVPAIGFLSQSVMIRRSLNMSLALTGVRNTITLIASRSESTGDTRISNLDVLSGYSGVVQKSLGLNWSLSATPYSTLTAMIMQSWSEGEAMNTPNTFSRQTMVNLFWNTRITQYVSGSLGLRHVTASTTAATGGNYRENAATATVGYKY